MSNGVYSIPLPGNLEPLEGVLPAGISRGGPLAEFVAGPENELAVTAILSALESSQRFCSPLVLYGPSGVGKSHLAGGLACEWLRRFPQSAVVHLFAAEFARDLSEAVETQNVSEWERKLRGAALLILEDLDHLAAKPAAQEHLARTLDVLERRGALVVATSSVAPYEANHLSAALRSRLSGGLTVPLALPGLSARTEIVRRLAAERGLPLDDEGAAALAAGLATGVRDLQGALLFLAQAQRASAADASSANSEVGSATYGTATQRFLTLGSLTLGGEEVAAYLATRRNERSPSVAAVAGRTAKYFSLKLTELRGPSRHRNLALARNVAIYLARNLTGQSLEKIGKYFGGRDHTTALHACRRIAELAEVDPETRRAVVTLREALSP